MPEQKIRYKPKSLKLAEHTSELFDQMRIQSGLSVNLFVYNLLINADLSQFKKNKKQ